MTKYKTILTALIVLVLLIPNICAGKRSINDYKLYRYSIKDGDTSFFVSQQFCFPRNKISLWHSQYKGKVSIALSHKYVEAIFRHFINMYNVDDVKLLSEQLSSFVMKTQIPPCLFLAIVANESGFISKTHSKTNDHGLMQINALHFFKYKTNSKEMATNLTKNITIGLDVLMSKQKTYNRWDWWVTYNTGSRFKLVKRGVDLAEQYRARIMKLLNTIQNINN